MTAFALNSTAMFLMFAATVVTLYAAGMVLTRRRLKKFRAPRKPEQNGQS